MFANAALDCVLCLLKHVKGSGIRFCFLSEQRVIRRLWVYVYVLLCGISYSLIHEIFWSEVVIGLTDYIIIPRNSSKLNFSSFEFCLSHELYLPNEVSFCFKRWGRELWWNSGWMGWARSWWFVPWCPPILTPLCCHAGLHVWDASLSSLPCCSQVWITLCFT